MKQSKTLFFFSVLTLFAILAILLWRSCVINNNLFIYSMDDTYIHMAIARNIATTGTWGVVNYEFSSTSSSLLYPLLLAGIYKYISQSELVPLFINIIVGILILYIIYRITLRYKLDRYLSILLYALAIFYIPLSALIITGMEHTLQIAIDLVYVLISLDLLFRKDTASRTDMVLISVLSVLVSMIRYEGMFLVFVVAIVFVLNRRYAPAFVSLFFCSLPVLIFGLYSVYHGSNFLPNPLILKANRPEFSPYGLVVFLKTWARNLSLAPHLLAIAAFLGIGLLHSRKSASPDREVKVFMAAVLGVIVVHSMFVGVGWFFRYEAYIMALGIVAAVLFLQQLELHKKHARVLKCLVVLIVFLPLLWQSTDTLVRTVPATRNIYEQQYQMALFAHRYFDHEGVALNDIGAVAYFADTRMLDLFGLASREVSLLKRTGAYTKDSIRSLARANSIRLVIIYDSWFQGLIPDEWIKVGEWTIADNMICAGPTVSFWATDKAGANRLAMDLKDFSPSLPRTVIQTGNYMEN